MMKTILTSEHDAAGWNLNDKLSVNLNQGFNFAQTEIVNGAKLFIMGLSVPDTLYKKKSNMLGPLQSRT